jgi:hypothetical protein
MPVQIKIPGEAFGCGTYNYVGGSFPVDPKDRLKGRIPEGYGIALDKYSGSRCYYFLHGCFEGGKLKKGLKVKVDDKSFSVKEGIFTEETNAVVSVKGRSNVFADYKSVTIKNEK